MSWFKVDDAAPDHPKIAALSNLAFRWWFKGLAYASRYLTDGVLPPVFWKQAPKTSRAELTTNKLWDWADPNFLIHDYLHHQMGKAEIEQDKERNREKAKAYRDRRRGERRKADASPVTLPDTLPDTLPTTGGGDVTDQITPTHTPDPTPHPTPNTLQTVEGGGKNPRPLTLIGRGESVKWASRHGHHLDGFCDWVCFDMEQVDDFAKRIPGDDQGLKRKQIRDWALAIRATWADRIVPDGSHFDFWRNRWTETHGGSKPANATLKAAKAAADLDEAFR